MSRLVPPGILLTRELIGWLLYKADEAQRTQALTEILLSPSGSMWTTPEEDQ